MDRLTKIILFFFLVLALVSFILSSLNTKTKAEYLNEDMIDETFTIEDTFLNDIMQNIDNIIERIVNKIK